MKKYPPQKKEKGDTTKTNTAYVAALRVLRALCGKLII
jgi:hypothetical protein